MAVGAFSSVGPDLKWICFKFPGNASESKHLGLKLCFLVVPLVPDFKSRSATLVENGGEVGVPFLRVARGSFSARGFMADMMNID